MRRVKDATYSGSPIYHKDNGGPFLRGERAGIKAFGSFGVQSIEGLAAEKIAE